MWIRIFIWCGCGSGCGSRLPGYNNNAQRAVHSKFVWITLAILSKASCALQKKTNQNETFCEIRELDCNGLKMVKFDIPWFGKWTGSECCGSIPYSKHFLHFFFLAGNFGTQFWCGSGCGSVFLFDADADLDADPGYQVTTTMLQRAVHSKFVWITLAILSKASCALQKKTNQNETFCEIRELDCNGLKMVKFDRPWFGKWTGSQCCGSIPYSKHFLHIFFFAGNFGTQFSPDPSGDGSETPELCDCTKKSESFFKYRSCRTLPSRFSTNKWYIL